MYIYLAREKEKIFTMEKEEVEVTSVWDSKAEMTAFDILKEKIDMENYQIGRHLALKEIFKGNKKESWMECHVDFIIEDLKGYPVLGIEINGIKHWNNPECRANDKKKKILFASAGVPLISIPLPELPSYSAEEYKTEYAKALKQMMEQFLEPYTYRTSFPVYCHKCGCQMEYRFKNDYTGAFYYCTNHKCDFQTISAEKIPLILKK